MNQAVANTVEQKCFVCVVSKRTPKPSDCLFQTSYRLRLSEEDARRRVFPDWPKALQNTEHLIEDKTYDRLFGQLRNELETSTPRVLIQDLLDIEYIQNHFRVGIADFVNVLTYANHVSRQLQIIPWLGSSVAIRKTNNN